MKKAWTDEGWEQYVYWQTQDRKTLKKINKLLEDIERNGTKGLGQSEKLKNHDGYSRRIDQENRLVFQLRDGELIIYACRGHYEA